jgi:hypothetical protein
MKLRLILVQNVLLILGIYSINRYFDWKGLYSQIIRYRDGQRLFHGVGVGTEFMGFPLIGGDEGVHYTEIMSVAQGVLIFGIISFVVSVGLLIYFYKTKGRDQK